LTRTAAASAASAAIAEFPAGPVFGSPGWIDLFVHACQEARRLDLELSLNIQSGWNLSGPKVTAEEATQTLVWSKTEIEGPSSTILDTTGSALHQMGHAYSVGDMRFRRFSSNRPRAEQSENTRKCTVRFRQSKV
jgi:hypothetical protein